MPKKVRIKQTKAELLAQIQDLTIKVDAKEMTIKSLNNSLAEMFRDKCHQTVEVDWLKKKLEAKEASRCKLWNAVKTMLPHVVADDESVSHEVLQAISNAL